MMAQDIAFGTLAKMVGATPPTAPEVGEVVIKHVYFYGGQAGKTYSQISTDVKSAIHNDSEIKRLLRIGDITTLQQEVDSGAAKTDCFDKYKADTVVYPDVSKAPAN